MTTGLMVLMFFTSVPCSSLQTCSSLWCLWSVPKFPAVEGDSCPFQPHQPLKGKRKGDLSGEDYTPNGFSFRNQLSDHLLQEAFQTPSGLKTLPLCSHNSLHMSLYSFLFIHFPPFTLSFLVWGWSSLFSKASSDNFLNRVAGLLVQPKGRPTFSKLSWYQNHLESFLNTNRYPGSLPSFLFSPL